MRLAISSCFDYDLPVADQFALLGQCRFELVSLGAKDAHSGYLDQQSRKRLLTLSERCGIGIDSLHVPIMQAYDLAKTDSERRMAAVCRVALCLASAAELGCQTIIVHLTHHPPVSYGRQLKPLLHSLEALIESAENMKIRIAAENLCDDTSLSFLESSLEEFDSDCFGLCYDSSHDQLSEKPPYQLLERYADRLFAVHLSDNDGNEDRHWLPFSGVVDWARICSVLREHDYPGPLLLEVESQPVTDPEAFLQEASQAAERLREMILTG